MDTHADKEIKQILNAVCFDFQGLNQALKSYMVTASRVLCLFLGKAMTQKLKIKMDSTSSNKQGNKMVLTGKTLKHSRVLINPQQAYFMKSIWYPRIPWII